MEKIIRETLEEILSVMKIPFAAIKINKEANSAYYTEIDTSASSLLIGWHGETIAALQHVLKCLLWKKDIPSDIQVIIDVDNYKKRQEESVIRLAERKAEWAVENKKEVILPPMNPYFRRKIHLHLADSDKFKNAVMTTSTGDGAERQVKIIPK